MTNEEIKTKGQTYLMNTFNRGAICMVEGQGSYLKDADGKQYLDFLAGIAVNALGHNHPKVTAAIAEQAAKLVHCSNFYWIEPQVQLAEKLITNSVLDKVFFGNSGAEANEGAIKLARKYGREVHGEGCYEIITADNSFHGRTLATLTATGQKQFHKDYDPFLEGFHYVPFNDFEALAAKVTEKTCAILLEPIQGEGGVYVGDQAYLQQVRALCDEKDILLIFDEVQTGMGRTGKLFAYEGYGVEPDVMTLAKALGNGVPIGALLAKDAVASHFKPSDHGSTFGGNPLVCAAAFATVQAIEDENILANVNEMGNYFKEKLVAFKEKYDFILDVRGKGLLLGMELAMKGTDIVAKCLEKGVIINCTHDTVLRFLPPLNVTCAEIDKAVAVMDEVFQTIEA